MVNKVCSTNDIHEAGDANNRSYVTYGDKLWARTNGITCNQYKPNIAVFIRDTVSIKDNQIHEAEHCVIILTFLIFQPLVQNLDIFIHLWIMLNI
jgi:hypothetical protein